MASPLQQASARRKVYYFGLIIVLFTVTLVWRNERFGDNLGLAAQTIEARAKALELREVDQGETELSGATVRLMLTGSRGLATCVLWVSAMEHQKKHEWDKLQLVVDALTTLQPHFLTPWLFQSWNLAYNVSVEAHSPTDVYYFIAQGIQLLAEGERVNRSNPDMRYSIAFYYQNKFGVHDQVDTMRSIMAISCMDPGKEHNRVESFYDPQTGEITDLEVFEQFCKENPQFIRRVRESKFFTTDSDRGLRLNSPSEVAEFVYGCRKIPSRYDPETGVLLDRLEQFPVLPPAFAPPFPDIEEPTENQELSDAFDGYLAARAWFQYSLLPLPKPSGEPEARPEASELKPGERIPRQPMLIIFRQGAPRAQSYHAERLEREGWFGPEGWQIDRDSSGPDRWFPGETVTIGEGTDWAQIAWERAYQMWSSHGESNGLNLTPEEEARYARAAQVLVDRGIARMEDITPEIRPYQRDDPQLVQAFEAHRRLMWYRQNRQTTNFPFFLASSEAEQDPGIIEARSLFFQAERHRQRGEISSAVRVYQAAVERWKQAILPQYEPFYRTQTVQEEALERDLRFIPLLGLQEKFTESQVVALALSSPLAGGSPFPPLGPMQVLGEVRAEEIPNEFPEGLMEGTAPDGKPWIDENVQAVVKNRLGIGVEEEIDPEAMQPAPLPGS